ncbi:putative WD40 repeat protein [Trypanosoma grayi]|uniref:putative WD40 repeat protein n=1 Tax=Trypanosoma grayi TaxID=71804 RepID=UPI0004F47E5D|nr:putative WD40 repeat protein [Trypanosoma grayi]KEG15668.1 putative WD40 repeat protein [Trypanosoma grayi]
MLAKKRAERKQAIATTAAAERKKELLRVKRLRHESKDGEDDEKEQKPRRTGKRDRGVQEEQAVDPMLLAAEEPTEVLRAIGDHVNTRLQELEFDDDIDADLFDEQQRQLREEAALAAGTKTRVLAPQIAAFLQKQQQQQHHEGVHADTGGVKMVRVGHNSNAVTAVCNFGPDVVVFGDKSGAVYIAELLCGPSSMVSQKSLLSPCLPAAVLAIAVSDTRGVRPSQRALFERSTVDTSITSYIAAGAADGTISIWVTGTRRHMGFLTMHRSAVTGLTFRHDTLYSCSNDETLRVWSVPQMICQDKLFGHQGRVFGVHCLKRERCASVGDDGTMRYWKVDAATQQEFATSTHFDVKVVLECVAMMNDNIVLCGAANGALLVFDVNRRKPIAVREAAHGYGFAGDGTGLEKISAEQASGDGARQAHHNSQRQQPEGQQQRRRQNPNPITAVASLPYSDVAASASYDGVVRLWQLTTPDDAKKAGRKDDGTSSTITTTTFECLASIPIDAIVTSLYFSPSSDVLVVGCSKEPRLGRWVVQRRALNAVCVVPLNNTTMQAFASCPNVEHVPAMLYGFTDEDDGEEATAAPAAKSQAGDANSDEASQSADVGDGDGDDDDDDGDEAGLFTVGEDGQMQFSAPVRGSDAAPRSGKKKKRGAATMKAVDRKQQSKRKRLDGKKKKKNDK